MMKTFHNTFFRLNEILEDVRGKSNERKTKFYEISCFVLFKIMNPAENQIYRFADVEVKISQNCR